MSFHYISRIVHPGTFFLYLLYSINSVFLCSPFFLFFTFCSSFFFQQCFPIFIFSIFLALLVLCLSLLHCFPFFNILPSCTFDCNNFLSLLSFLFYVWPFSPFCIFRSLEPRSEGGKTRWWRDKKGQQRKKGSPFLNRSTFCHLALLSESSSRRMGPVQ